MLYVIQLASKIRMFRPDPARKLSASLYDIYHCDVYSAKTPDDGQRNCPKHVGFYCKNKFQKLVHLVGFIIRIACRNSHHESSDLQSRILFAVPTYFPDSQSVYVKIKIKFTSFPTFRPTFLPETLHLFILFIIFL